MNSTGELHLALANDLSELARSAAVIEQFLEPFGVEGSTVGRLNLALDELLTNTINYGYSDGQPHDITVHVTIRDHAIETVIEDDGAAFDPFARTPPDITLSVEDREIGGLGIHLVRELMDNVNYTRQENRNRVVLTVKCPEASMPDDHPSRKDEMP